MEKNKNKSRKYFRKCGSCGTRLEQSQMIRTNISDNGWLCPECYYGATFYDEPHLEDSAFDYDW